MVYKGLYVCQTIFLLTKILIKLKLYRVVWQSTRRHLNNLWYNICQWVLLYMHRSPWNNCKATSRPGMFSLSCKHDKPEKTFIMIYFFSVILRLQKGSSVAKFGLHWPRKRFFAQEEMNGGCLIVFITPICIRFWSKDMESENSSK